MPHPPARGATANPPCRYNRERLEAFDDGWTGDDETPRPLETVVTPEATRRIITTNDSPDVGFDRSINPYKGCEHGCVYCFARPTHAYLGLSPGLDFESRIFSKPEAAERLREELARPGYTCEVLAVGANTDPYQPTERRLRITRGVLEVLSEFRHPVAIVTKSALVTRDLDLLVPMASQGLASVFVSVTTLDRSLARRMEPRAATPERRLETVRALSDAGVPVGVLVAPVIPGLTDHELEAILEAAAAARAKTAGYVLLRLPLELKELFDGWLDTHYPLRKARILALVRSTRGGALYQSAFGTRQRGTGPYADLLKKRFDVAVRRVGLDRHLPELETGLFRVPGREVAQLALFREGLPHPTIEP